MSKTQSTKEVVNQVSSPSLEQDDDYCFDCEKKRGYIIILIVMVILLLLVFFVFLVIRPLKRNEDDEASDNLLVIAYLLGAGGNVKVSSSKKKEEEEKQDGRKNWSDENAMVMAGSRGYNDNNSDDDDDDDPRTKEYLALQHKHDYMLLNCSSALPKFCPGLYDNNPKYEKYNNCYFYAFSDLNMGMSRKWQIKPQPGSLSNIPPTTYLSLDALLFRIRSDHPKAIWISKDSSGYPKICPCGFYTVIFLLDDSFDTPDFHFLKDGELGFSHKPGSGKVSIVDAENNYIYNPDNNNFDYSSHGGSHYTIRGKFYVPIQTISYIDGEDFPVNPF
jgi:hypothetical protein